MNFKGSILFTTGHAETLGNANRLEMMRYLAEFFDVTIHTNQIEFVRRLFPDTQVIELPQKSNSKLTLKGEIADWKTIAREINKTDSDFVFMVYNNSPVALYLRKPVFQYVHQYGQRVDNDAHWVKKILKGVLDNYREHLILKGLKKSTANFVVSRPIIELLSFRGVSNLHFTPHGMDLQKYRKPVISEAHKPLQSLKEEGFFLVAYTGWVTENRGFKLMLNSLKEAVQSDPKVALVIAGADAVFSRKIHEFSRDNGLESHIVNFGVVDLSLIPGILHHSDVCLSFLDDVPAYRISPPQKVVEYFAAGKPVICNRIEPHEWLVENEVNGFIVDPEPPIVAAHILKMKEDEVTHAKMSENALKAAEQCDINKIYGSMVQKIRESLSERQRIN